MRGVIRLPVRGRPSETGSDAAENLRFQRFFTASGNFMPHARTIHAIVVIGIVPMRRSQRRPGSHSAHQAGNSGSGDDAGKLGARAGFLETRCNTAAIMRTRFTRVHAKSGPCAEPCSRSKKPPVRGR